jgi:tRNA(fMet)-specific endonuclease VapC
MRSNPLGAGAAATPIGSNDMLIAAHAKSVGAIVVTANSAEFPRVRGLQVTNCPA